MYERGVACERGRVQSKKGAWLYIKEAWPIPKALVMPARCCNGERWVEVAFKMGAWLIREGAWLTRGGVTFAGRGVALC